MFTYLTAGESHGPQLTGIIEGFPAGMTVDIQQINSALTKRQGGYGRGNRQKIEHDQIQITGGIRHQTTLGSPISLTIQNQDFSHWQDIMDPLASGSQRSNLRQVKRPRPGHADLVGGMKYRHQDLRNVLERSSARETAMRVAIGNLCEQLLQQLDIHLVGYVYQVGPQVVGNPEHLGVAAIQQQIQTNELRIVDSQQEAKIKELIDQAKLTGDTLGGVLQVIVENVPAGLGSYTSWDTKFDAQIAASVMGINAMKGVSFGDGFLNSKKLGSQAMDPIAHQPGEWYRLSNHLGGFEGGMTNGMPLIVNAAMKPLPTLYHALQSVNIDTKEVQKANVERSDTTAIVPAALVVQSVVTIELVKQLTTTFDGSNLGRLQEQVAAYRQELAHY
ncbi:chorismate synthase [Bombilactobacillus folatiphilus]|uniref:Chorismate synthase n=1 Tax=Bombilactobacillus folatiphilus TaxID=2923362 RepID=A0ABY4P9W5_9LACO|nr:chorismate synthase [Bombilactobacillus folatiphilus]UQS82395.1 chorismate synthase [Bombilactobacillus folatiphilus]